MATLHHISFCLRPSSAGVWFIQHDIDHAPWGVDMVTGVIHDPDGLRVYFTPVFNDGGWAGDIQFSYDDGFAGSIHACANLGTQGCKIFLREFPAIRAIDPVFNPADIWKVLPPVKGYDVNNGNLWVNARMQKN